VVVTERKSPREERATEEAIANGFLMENGEKGSQKRSNLTENDEEIVQNRHLSRFLSSLQRW
jgi:hypothetical protein